MQEVNPTSNLDKPDPARKLNREFYDIYTIEDENQTRLYIRLAQLVTQLERDNESALIESVNPGFYVEDNMGMHTLLVTVAH